MATISVNDLNLTGSELLLDEESFLKDLSDEKLRQNRGGATPILVPIAIGGFALGYTIGRDKKEDSMRNVCTP